MTEKKGKRSRKTTGVFPGLWCWLLTPDTRWSEDGVYSVDLVMTTDEARDLCKSVGQDVVDQSIAIKTKNPSVKDWKLVWPAKDYDGEDQTLAGKKIVSFKQKIKPGYNFKVDVFDAKNNQIDPASGLRIGNGTKLRLCFSPRVVEDNMNKCLRVMFHPLAAQIIDLVPWEADYGFEETEGFTAGSNGTQRGVSSMRPKQEASVDPFGDEQPGSDPVIDDIPF